MSVAAVQNELHSVQQPVESVFPLSLSDFEFYMFADDRPSHPMVFVMLVNHANADYAEAAQRALLEWTYAYRPTPAEHRHRKR